jgi:hypothetical protein
MNCRRLPRASTIRNPLLALLLAGSATAAAYPLGKVVDSFDAVPGAPPGTTFDIERYAPALRGGVIVFATQGAGIQALWRTGPANGGYTRLVDTTTAIPSGSGTFADLLPFRFDGVHLAFRGDDAASQAGYYAKPIAGGALAMLANQDTPVPPDGTTTFGVLIGFPGGSQEPFAVDAGDLVFQDNHAVGVYALPLAGGSVRAVAHAGLVVCESQFYLPDLWAAPAVSDGVVAMGVFNVFGNGSIYLAPLSGVTGSNDACATPALRADNVTRVASLNVTMPGGASFHGFSFGAPRIDGDTVVFRGGDGHGYFGLFASTPAGIVTLADTNTPVPGGDGDFQPPAIGFSLDRYVIGGGRVIFRGTDASNVDGLYVATVGGGPVAKLVRVGDTLPDGRVVFGASGVAFAFDPFQVDSLDGDRIALNLLFTDPVRGFGTGVYVGELGDLVFRDGFDAP